MSLIKEFAEAMMALRLSPLMKIKRDGFSLRFYPTHMSLSFWLERFRRRPRYASEERLFRACLGPGATMIDVGANVGYYALLGAAAVGPTGRVYAIEAHPRIFKYLQKNIALNGFGHVEAVHLAVGNTAGQTQVSDRKDDNFNQVGQAEGIAVPMGRLDDLDTGSGAVALLKVDVEGYEKFVFEGARRLLERTECVYFESCNIFFRQFGYSIEDVFDLLGRAGFTIFRFRDEGLSRLPVEYSYEGCENMLALREPEQSLERMGLQVQDDRFCPT